MCDSNKYKQENGTTMISELLGKRRGDVLMKLPVNKEECQDVRYISTGMELTQFIG